MILKLCLLVVLFVAWEASAASYSNVFVQTGPETVPAVKYYGQYGAPAYSYEYAAPQVAQYKAAYEYPIGHSFSYGTAYQNPNVATVAAAPPSANILTYSVPRVSNVASVAAAPPSANVIAYSAPTVSDVATVAAVPSSANVITYSAPSVSNVPVLLEGKTNPGYEYSYTYFNQEAAPELKQLSDGEVLRGYTLVQPELVRYVPDNSQGFNAIFKNYLPTEEVKHTEIVQRELVQPAAPCHEAKSGALMVEHEESHGNPHVEHEVHEKVEHESHEPRHGSEPETHVEHVSHVEHHEHSDPHESEHDHVHEIITVHIDHVPESEHDHTDHKDHVVVEEHEIVEESEKENEAEESPAHESHGHSKQIHEVHGHSEHALQGHGHSEKSREGHGHNEHKPEGHGHSEHTHEDIVEEPHYSGHETTLTVVPEQPPVLGSNVLIPYNDFIKCIQAAMARGTTHPYPYPYSPVSKPTSPLTYLIFNKPC